MSSRKPKSKSPPASQVRQALYSVYPDKFIAIHYIEMMLEFISTSANNCIFIFGGIDNVTYIKGIEHFKRDTHQRLANFEKSIARYRYKYTQDDLENEVRCIEFFFKKRGIECYTNPKTFGYYINELKNIWNSIGHPRNGNQIAKKQHTYISTILNNTQYSDEQKLEKIQEYTTEENKALVEMVNMLIKMSLISVEEKLKFITEKIDELGKIIDERWKGEGKISYENYLKIIRKQETLGGKRGISAKRGVSAKRGGGMRSLIKGFNGIFRRDKSFIPTKIIPMKEDISQDYISQDYIQLLNIYKGGNDGHIEKLRRLYDKIASIFNYAEYHRHIASEPILLEYERLKQEYRNLFVTGDIVGNYPLNYTRAMKKMFESLESQSSYLEANAPDLADSSHFVRHIHIFRMLKGRKEGLERNIAMYYA